MPKRIFDLLFSAVALIVLAPFFVLIALAIRWDSAGPVLFRQERVGRGGRVFRIRKFRTMVVDAPARGPAITIGQDSRITRVGAWLRRTKLDELPQLLDVLRGDMSLVGPRPCLFIQTELIQAREAKGIFDVRPGITGLAQVNGVDMSDPMRLATLDAEMLRRLTVLAYLRFIVWTATGRGAGDQVRG